MKVIALISGGKDSCYNMMQCVLEGHDIVALANLSPGTEKDELDSYMYQTVGHDGIDLYGEAMELPLYRKVIRGTSKNIEKDYTVDVDDEVEDLYELLKQIMEIHPAEAVSVGAILSNYQRVRVENVCARLHLTALSYLWRRDQQELLQEMIGAHVSAIIIKVASLGLDPQKHLGMSLQDIYPHMLKMHKSFGVNICGEGGEYETFTLDCPLFKKCIVIDETEIVIHSDDAYAPVGYLRLTKLRLEEKQEMTALPLVEYLKSLHMKGSHSLMAELDFSEPQSLCTITDEYDIPVWSKVTSNNMFYISGVSCRSLADETAADLATSAMNKLQASVHNCGAAMSDLVTVSLYVQDMTDFDQINPVYKSYFGINPPCRVCVQASLPRNVFIHIDACGLRQCDSQMSTDRHTMHVQGISHWAPANIGPYSQAVQINNCVYIAGQIALCPGTMKLIDGGRIPQCRLSLRHVARVLAAMGSGYHLHDIRTAVCYMTDISFIPIAEYELRQALQQDPEVSKEQIKRVSQNVSYIVVAALPKGAGVEWQVWAATHEQPLIYITDEEDGLRLRSLDKNCMVTLRSWCSDYGQTDSQVFACTGIAKCHKLAEVCQSSTSGIIIIKTILHLCQRLIDRCYTSWTQMPPLRIFFLKHMSHANCIKGIEEYFAENSPGKDVPPISLVPVEELYPPDVCAVFTIW